MSATSIQILYATNSTQGQSGSIIQVKRTQYTLMKNMSST